MANNKIVVDTRMQDLELDILPLTSDKPNSSFRGYAHITIRTVVGHVYLSLPIFQWVSKKTGKPGIGIIGKISYKVGDDEKSLGSLSGDLRNYINRLIASNLDRQSTSGQTPVSNSTLDNTFEEEEHSDQSTHA